MKRSDLKKTALAAGIGVLVLVGATAAFLTSSDVAYNLFSVGKVDLDVEEDFDKDQTLAAGQIITKTPWIRNTGTVNEVFFAEVCVPVMRTTLVDASGQRIPPAGAAAPNSAEGFRQDAEIFHLLTDSGTEIAHATDDPMYGSFAYHGASETKKGWYYLGEGTTFTVTQEHPKEGFAEGTYHSYLFGYNAWVAPKDVTVPIFDKVQLRSMIDSELTGQTIGQVTVLGYALQADALGITTLTGNGDTALYTQADTEAMYRIYQNKNAEAQGGN